jgi:hypothetical protein
MGLLHRAAVREKAALNNSGVSKLDDMGQALAGRILRLPCSSSRAESALNLLKPYHRFQSGFCSSLSGEAYVPYAAVGIDRTAALLNKDKLGPLKRGFGKLNLAPAPFRLWTFPLGNNSALFLNENPSNPFNASLAGALLEKIKPALLPPGDASKPLPVDEGVELGGGEENLEALVGAYYRNNGPFHILIVCRDSSRPEKSGADFHKTLSHSLSFGEVIPVKAETCLILFPKPLNPLLVSHRLSNSFGARELLHFEASGIQEALKRIHDYLKP